MKRKLLNSVFQFHRLVNLQQTQKSWKSFSFSCFPFSLAIVSFFLFCKKCIWIKEKSFRNTGLNPFQSTHRNQLFDLHFKSNGWFLYKMKNWAEMFCTGSSWKDVEQASGSNKKPKKKINLHVVISHVFKIIRTNSMVGIRSQHRLIIQYMKGNYTNAFPWFQYIAFQVLIQ